MRVCRSDMVFQAYPVHNSTATEATAMSARPQPAPGVRAPLRRLSAGGFDGGSGADDVAAVRRSPDFGPADFGPVCFGPVGFGSVD